TLENAHADATLFHLTDYVIGSLTQQLRSNLESGWRQLIQEGLKKHVEHKWEIGRWRERKHRLPRSRRSPCTVPIPRSAWRTPISRTSSNARARRWKSGLTSSSAMARRPRR